MAKPATQTRRGKFHSIFVFSVLKTLIFWLSEMAFWMIWNTDSAKYIGAILGLTPGHALKFMLDRSCTFKEPSA